MGGIGVNVAQQLGVPAVVLLDTETTGLNPRENDIIELALVRVEATGARYEYCALMKSEQFISPELVALNGITPERVAIGLRPEKVLRHFWDVMSDDPVLVAHNAQFDLGMVAWNSIRRGVEFRMPPEFICTRFMANALYPRGSHKLQGLIKRFGYEYEQTHRAIDDLDWTERIMLHMLPEIQKLGIRWKNSCVYLGGVDNDDYGLTGINWQPWGFRPKE
jgi:DNA polymerase-3 subunit alpha (Gram-positive type)